MSDSHIIVDDGQQEDARLAYVLEHIDAEFLRLREHIDLQFSGMLVEHTRKMSKDSDLARPYWASGAEHMGDHAMGKVGRWVLRGVLALALGLVVYLSARFGVIK